jgi:transcriptional regulator with XRE-family HTH domain
MLGSKIKELREKNGFVQRQLAAEIEVDTAYISKVENEEKFLSRQQIPKISKLFKVDKNELETLWLSDKIMSIIGEEKNSLKVLNLTINRIKRDESK